MMPMVTTTRRRVMGLMRPANLPPMTPPQQRPHSHDRGRRPHHLPGEEEKDCGRDVDTKSHGLFQGIQPGQVVG
jgi:hypothetical protein